ncbi:MAG: beta-methylarginine biosynthesis bifunctional aminotransferase, partial [Tumebacillaceae bacterium]
MKRITSKDSPYTLLQQRLLYMSQAPERDWTPFIENVPQWSKPFAFPPIDLSLVAEYAPCNGYSVLLDAIRERDNERYELDLGNEHLLVTNGALHALALIFQQVFQPGAVALVQAPVLGSVAESLENCGYRIVAFQSEQGEINMEELRDLTDENVRLLYLNSPHNPTGDILTQSTLQDVVAFAEPRGIRIVADMIYDSFAYDFTENLSPLAVSENWDLIYTVNSMSKNYGSPGLRIGWITSSPANIATLSGVLEMQCVSINGIAQHQAAALIRAGNEELVDRVAERKAFILAQLTEMEGIEWGDSKGATQIYVKFPVDDIDLFADYMLEVH